MSTNSKTAYVAYRQDGSEVKRGDILTLDGETMRFECATAVTVPGKSGKVFVVDTTNPNKQWKRELYAHLFGLKVRLVSLTDPENTYSYHFPVECETDGQDSFPGNAKPRVATGYITSRARSFGSEC